MVKRTTVRLQDSLLERAKLEARQRGLTLTGMIEQGLELLLAQQANGSNRPWVRLPVPQSQGGTLPGVDLNNNASLLDLLESS